MDIKVEFGSNADNSMLKNDGSIKLKKDDKHIEKKIKLSPCDENRKFTDFKSQRDKHLKNQNKTNPCKKDKDNSDDNDGENIVYEDPEEGFVYPLEMNSSDMLDEVDLIDGYFPSVTERYFTSYYHIDFQKPGEDFRILIHSNRICMITLAPSHILFQQKKTIQSINYKVSDKLDRTKNKVSGKSKHGAQPLQQNSNLCCVTCTDGSSYMVKCCMIGKLIEVNPMIRGNPKLLYQEPHFGGWIAILLPNLKHLDRLKEQLLTQEHYEEALKDREKKNEIQMKEDQDKEIEKEIAIETNSSMEIIET